MATYEIRVDPVAGVAVWRVSSRGAARGVLLEDLRLSRRLSERFSAWIAWGQLLHEAPVFPTADGDSEEWERFDNEGHDLARCFQRELGREHRVSYYWETDLDEIWDQNRDHLVLRVFAQDSVTGFSRVAERFFHSKTETVKDGIHRFGDSLEVGQ